MNQVQRMALPHPRKLEAFEHAYMFQMDAQSNGQTYRIHVAAPLAIEPGRQYPVIYVLDGNLYFGMVMQMQRLMAMIAGEVPHAYIVAIGCASDDLMGTDMQRRYRDLTPTAGGELESAINYAAACEHYLPGGGPRFLAFLRDELKPAIEALYPVDRKDATIMGASLGGLFPLWLLFTEPGLFQRYISVSPSMWWEREAIWGWEEQLAAQVTDLPAHLFISAGETETADNMQDLIDTMRRTAPVVMRERIDVAVAAYEKHGYPRAAEITPVLADRLKARGYRSLRVHCHNMPDETHTSVPPSAFARGLRYVFGNWEPDA